MHNAEFNDLASLKRYLDNRFPNAGYGVSSLSATGEEYVEIAFSALSRSAPTDEEIVSRFVVIAFSQLLMSYLDQTRGQLYWRIPLEEGWIDAPQVVRYDDNGPDIDFYTDRRCFLDRDWKRYGIYCRLLRSDKPVKEFA
jgi:hypothetical protein